MARSSDQDPLHLPPFAEYDCELCGWCCGQYYVTFSDRDRERLLKKDWDTLVPQVAGVEWCEPTNARPPQDPWQLRWGEDGRCVFLGTNLLCQMHEHVTEMGKPLPCTTFPFTMAFTPSGTYVGLRYSCRAVASNRGRPVETRRPFLERLRKRLLDEGHCPRYTDPIDFDGKRTLSWANYLKLEDVLIATLLRADMDLTRRVVMAWRIVSLVGEWDFDRLKGHAFFKALRELVERLGEGFAEVAIPEQTFRAREALMHRQFANIFHRRTGPVYFRLSVARKLLARWRWFLDGVRFAKGRGKVRIHDTAQPIELSRIESVHLAPFDEEQSRLLSNYLAGKLFAKHVFGALFFRYPFRQGYTFLTAAYAAILWYARGIALADERDVVATKDIAAAIRLIDFCYGYSKAPSLRTERLRVWTLAREDAAVRLAVAYGP